MKQALFIVVCFVAFSALSGTGYSVWYEHQQIESLQSQVSGLSAQIVSLKKSQVQTFKNEKVLNYNQDQIAAAVRLIMKALMDDPEPDKNSYRKPDPRNHS